MYHDVSDVPLANAYRARLNVPLAEFSAQLDYLKCAGYTTVTPSRMLEAIAGRGALPQRPVMLTFDDGYASQYAAAFPLLMQREMTGAFAVITGHVGTGVDYMNWAQIREMSGAGMEIMSHTVTHIDLGKASDDVALSQLRDSRAAIEERTARAPGFLAYPAGEPFRSGSHERQAEVMSLVEEAGYRGALLAGPSSAAQDPSRPFAFSRLRVGAGVELATYAAIVGGPPPEMCSERAGATTD